MATKRDPSYIYLSPSKLNSADECPRCYWLKANKAAEFPDGIMAGITHGMDRTIKAHYDKHRPSLPPELVGQVEGQLFKDQATLKKWRYWGSAPEYRLEDLKVIVQGAVDDVAVDGEFFMPLDAKTKASEEKAAVLEDVIKYNQTQLDCYALFFITSGLKVNGRGYVANYFPMEIESSEAKFSLNKTALVPYRFGCIVHRLSSDAERAKEKIEKAAKLVRGPMPPATASCSFCQFANQYVEAVERTFKSKEGVAA